MEPSHYNSLMPNFVSKEALTAERLREELNYNSVTGEFSWNKRRVGRRDSVGYVCESNGGYRMIRVLGVSYKASRLAWLHFYGVWPPDEIDHINRVRTDDRIHNLRTVSRAENNRNRKSGHLWNKGKKL